MKELKLQATTISDIDKIALLYQCTFLPGSWDKKFVNDIHWKMKNGKTLTEKQQIWLDKLFHRYRKQIANIRKRGGLE